MSRIVVVPHRRTRLAWHSPMALTRGDDSQPTTHRYVEVELEPGESSSVRVGKREYVTVKRPLRSVRG